MLAASLDGVDLETLRFPLYISPKLDGIRCIIHEGIAYSRNAKPIRNRFVQKWAAELDGLDGELIVGSETDPLCMNNTQSGIMSADGEPDFCFHAFDLWGKGGGFQERFRQLQDGTQWPAALKERFKVVNHTIVRDATELRRAEAFYLEKGYEGVMARSLHGPYKQGRSTLREGYLLKLKRFMDGEATVVAIEEAMENGNELQRDELGRAKRTSHQENLRPKGMVGVIIVQDPTWGTMRLSPGVMTHRERVLYWNNPTDLKGQRVHWRAFGYGVKDTPRFPRFYGIREDA